MAAPDVRAGKAYVEFYVRDFAFRRRVAENQALLEDMQSLGQAAPAGDSVMTTGDAYGELAAIGEDAMESLYLDTLNVTDATYELLEVLESVYDSYLDLAELQGAGGISLQAGQPGMMGADGEQRIAQGGTYGFKIGDLKKQVGEGFEAIPESALKAIGSRIGMSLFYSEGMQRFMKAVPLLGKSLASGADKMTAAGGSTGGAAGTAVTELAKSALSAAMALWNLRENVIDAEIIPQQAAVPRLPAPESEEVVEAEIAPPAVNAPVLPPLPPPPPPPTPTTVPPTPTTVSEETSSMTALASEALLVADALATLRESLLATVANTGNDVTKGAQLAAPVLDTEASVAFESEGLDDVHSEMMEKLSPVEFHSPGVLPVTVMFTSGGISDIQNAITQLSSQSVNTSTSMTAMASATTKTSAATGIFTKVMTAARFALVTVLPVVLAVVGAAAAAYVAFKTLKLAVDAIKLPFTLAGKAVDGMVYAVKAIPKLIGTAIDYMKRFAAATWEAVKSVSSTAWSAAVGTFNAVGRAISNMGATVKTTGKMLAYIGGGMAALGAAITVPLTKAAQQFSEHGSKIKLLTQQYRMLGLAEEDASVYSYMASQASGQLATLGEQERIQRLMQTVKIGSQEYENWRKQAEAAGLVMGGSGLSAASALSTAYRRLKDSLSGLWVTLGSAVAPAITDWTETIVGAIRGATEWVSKNKQLIATVFNVATAIGTAGTVIASLGGALMGVGSIISPFAAILAAIAGGMAVVEYRTGLARSAWDAYSGSVMKVYETAKSVLGPMLAHVKETMGGVMDAIKGGDLALAAKIAWNGLKIAWMEGLLWLSDRTSGAFGGILKNLAAGKWKDAAQGAMSMIRAAFLRGLNYLDEIWTNLKTTAQSAFTAVVGYAGELWLNIADRLDPMWLAFQDGFGKVKQWGIDAFNTISDYAAGAVAAFKSMLPTLKTMLVVAAALNPTMALGVAAAVKAIDKVAKGTSKAFSDAVKAAKQERERLAANAESPERQETLEERREKRRTEFAELQNRLASNEASTRLAAETELAKRMAERERQILELEKKAKAGGGEAATQARDELEQLKAEQAVLAEQAKKVKKEGEQPDAIEVQGKMSGLVSSSAFAFGSLGMGGGTVADRQLEEQRKTREEARKREVEERAARKELVKEAKAQGITLKEMLDRMKQMGIFAPG